MQEWRYRIFSKILSTPIRRVMKIPLQPVLARKLDLHFRSDENILFDRHVFRQLAPTDGESVDKFVASPSSGKVL